MQEAAHATSASGYVERASGSFFVVEMETMADTPSTEAADLEAGYSDTPTATPAVAAPAPETPTVEPVVVPDPMKAVLERLDKYEATTSKLAGHIGGLTRTQQEIQQALAASKVAAKVADNAPTQAQVKDAISSPKEWDALKEEYPDWAQGMEKLLDHRLAAHQAPPAEDFQKVLDAKLQAQLAAQASERVSEVSEIHPGWVDDLWTKDAAGTSTRTADYEAWAKTMTPEQLAKFENSNSVLYVDRKLTEFYAWKKAQAAQAKPVPTPAPRANVSTRQKRLEAAVTPRGTGGHASGGSSDIDEMEAGYSG